MPGMDEIRELAFSFCMKEEGGSKYTNDPADPGGPTKYGIALKYNGDVIPDKNGDGVIDARDVQALTEADARKIYREVYWQRHKCDMLPGPVAFIYGDMVFNPGPGAAARLLQQSLNALGARLAVDGVVGPATLAEAGVQYKAGCEELLCELTARRQHYYASRAGFSRYGLGWSRRASRCLVAALRVYREIE